MDYFTGVGISFLISTYVLFMTIATLNSTYARNFRRLGYRISWSSLRPEKTTRAAMDGSVGGRGLKITLWLLLLYGPIILSWLNVFFSLGMLLYNRSKNSGAPQDYKEFLWKLRNLDMSTDQLIALSAQLEKVPEEQQEEYRLKMQRDILERGFPLE